MGFLRFGKIIYQLASNLCCNVYEGILLEKLALFGGEPIRTKPLPTVSNKSGRNIGDEELKLLKEVVESGSLFRHSGKMVSKFEEEFEVFRSKICCYIYFGNCSH